MGVYNTNQNRQFYVVKSKVNNLVDKIAAKTANLGDVEVCELTAGNQKQLFFKHMGHGGLTRTDLIDVDKICYARLTTAEEMQRKLKTTTVTLNEDYLTNGKPIVGQDYVLRIQINNYLSPGDASVLIKSAAVHATKTMDAKTFYEKMVESLKKNFSREPQPLLEFEATEDGIVITEVGDQPWRLGVLSQDAVNFEVIWADVDEKTGRVKIEVSEDADPVGNGKQIADLEYFCQAERGDMFRNMGWPNNIDVKYMVDPDKEYNVLDIHYYFSGNGVQVHKSEKDITFVEAGSTTVLDAIVAKLTELGITVQKKV